MLKVYIMAIEAMVFDQLSVLANMRRGRKLRALPRVPAKGPLKPYRGTIHKTKAPPTAL
jgi:hypothetical protein